MIENPTEKDLRTLEMIIYCITNKITGQQYVGKATRTFLRRYPGNEWWKKPSNSYLKNSVNKYGLENFRIAILEHSIKTNRELNKLEKHYIKKLKTQYPKGYNYLDGGDDINALSYESRCKIQEVNCREFELFDHHKNETIKSRNLNKFCNENNLSETTIRGVLDGKYKQHKQYTLPGATVKKYRLISPSGEEYTVLNGEMSEFCRQHNICHVGIFQLCKGKIIQYLNWTCPDFPPVERNTYILRSPKGDVHSIKAGEVKPFCENFDLNYSCVYSLIAGRLNTHKNWTFIETKRELRKI